MIWHEAIGRNSDCGLGVGLGQNHFNDNVVSRFLKQGESPDSAVKDVVGEISSSKAWTAWYTGVCNEIGMRLSRKDSRPLLWISAGHSGSFSALRVNGGRNAATILSLR